MQLPPQGPDEREIIASEAVEAAWGEALRKTIGSDSKRKKTTPFARYAELPVEFGVDILGQTFWAGQEAIMRAVIKHRKVTVRAGRKEGKTHCAAALIEAMMQTAPTIAICTAAVERQVRDNIFAKVRVMHARAKATLLGEVGVMSLRIDDDWFAIGVAANDPDNILGFHGGVEVPVEGVEQPIEKRKSVFDVIGEAKEKATRLLIILDESVGIEQSIFDALEGSISGDNVYVLMISNPRMSADSGHTFANSFRDGSGWYRIHIAAEEPKNDPTPADECFHSVPEWLCPKKWIDERRNQWGEESPLFHSDVLGCFTDGAVESQVIPMHVLEGAAKWEILDDERATSRHIGCDLAGGETAGADFCVATLWINGVLSCVHRWKSPDTMDSIAIVEALVERWGPPGQRIPWTNVHIDATGIGKGACDRLKQKGLYVDAVNFGAKARYCWKGITGDMKFRDYKSELYWDLRRALQEGIACIPRKYNNVWRELQWHTHKMVPRANDTALALVESKDVLRERYGHSPDFADAAVLAWARGSMKPRFWLADPGKILRQ